MSKDFISPEGILKKGTFTFLSRNFKLSISKAEQAYITLFFYKVLLI